MKRILGIILRVLLTLFVVITAGFLLMALGFIVGGGEMDLPPVVQTVLQGITVLYLVDIALLLIFVVGFVIRYITLMVKQGEGKTLLKSLLIQVPIAIVIGLLIDIVERLIVDGNIWEGGMMYTPIILAVGVVVYRLYPRTK